MNKEPRAFDAKDSDPNKKFNKIKAAFGALAVAAFSVVGGAFAYDLPSKVAASERSVAADEANETLVATEREASEVSPEKVKQLNEIRANFLDKGVDSVEAVYTFDITAENPILVENAIAEAGRQSDTLLTGENIGEIKMTSASVIEERRANGQSGVYSVGEKFNLYKADFDEDGKPDYIVGESVK